jgi:Protein of unknown function (DUF2996)
MADPTNHNQAGEVAPSTVDKQAPSVPEEHAPSTDSPAAKATKKEKAPAVEDKPFVEFIQQDYLPALQKAIAQQGVQDLQVSFAKQKVLITGFESAEECWQIIGSWSEIGRRQFNLYFPEEDIQGQKGFSCNEGKKPSTLESFLIDERKTTLDLLVFGLVQRLDGQKWLGRN